MANFTVQNKKNNKFKVIIAIILSIIAIVLLLVKFVNITKIDDAMNSFKYERKEHSSKKKNKKENKEEIAKTIEKEYQPILSLMPVNNLDDLLKIKKFKGEKISSLYIHDDFSWGIYQVKMNMDVDRDKKEIGGEFLFTPRSNEQIEVGKEPKSIKVPFTYDDGKFAYATNNEEIKKFIESYTPLIEILNLNLNDYKLISSTKDDEGEYQDFESVYKISPDSELAKKLAENYKFKLNNDDIITLTLGYMKSKKSMNDNGIEIEITDAKELYSEKTINLDIYGY